MKMDGVFLIIKTVTFLFNYVATATRTLAGIEPKCQDFPYHPVCPLYSQPLCGTNSVTYTNLCYLCLYNWGTGFKVKILHEGQCGTETRSNQKLNRSRKTY
ncbi:trypsin inhibitor ClTI-1-like [Chiloscyllium plagiosum]|uniref:trypsin inhibitor ClTI-1-like n=1 Tax=Chiloscyllium plagiosum TaxID=36176 RepID=UPI001CB7C88E|nr:trypsin inhibitor ClTI-1-like [Chiloscyllium plagiosum]